MYRIVPKPWGREIIYLDTPAFTMKRLFINEGCRFSLQSHSIKNEGMVVEEGRGVCELESSNNKIISQIKVNDTLCISPGSKHRIKALENLVLLEVSVPGQMDNDIIRYEDDYGRVTTDAKLQTSTGKAL